jgi:2,3-bisphosphoglycerate-dependent phosphoglycerate mutase
VTIRAPGILVLLRHGESTANAAGLFTGILDAPLSDRGAAEARSAAALLAVAGLTPDVVFTSVLQRARRTADIVVGELQPRPASPRADWRLNERNYGALTGRSKADVRGEFGEAQFLAWRRSVNTAPPPLSDEDFAATRDSLLFRSLPAEALTRTEALNQVMARVGRFHVERVLPLLRLGRIVLVVAHGNSLRAYCAVLDGLDDHAIHRLNLPTGHPLVYRFAAGDLEERAPMADLPRRRLSAGGRYLDEAGALPAAARLTADGGT